MGLGVNAGHDLDLSNLFPICDRCNLSMADNFTIQEWNDLNIKKKYDKKNYIIIFLLIIIQIQIYYDYIYTVHK